MVPFSQRAEYWDVEESQGSGTSIRLRNGEVVESKNGESVSFKIRAFDRGAWAYSSTSEEKAVRALVEKTCENALKLSRLVKKKYSLGDFSRGKSGYKTPAKKNPADVELSRKLAKVREILSGAEGVANTEAGYSDSEGEIRLRTSEGLEISQKLASCGFALSCIAKEGDLVQRIFRSERKTAGFEVVDALDASFAEDCARRAKALLSAGTPPSGKMTILMDPLLVGTFVHEAVGHMAEADNVANDDSILKGKVGRRIGSGLVTIVDDKTTPGGYGTRGFDRDGAKSERTVLIENGLLRNYIQSRNSAGKLLLARGKSTGNCWGAFNNVRMSNTFALPGKASFGEILKETKEGVYLIGSSGGTAQTADGTFNFSAMEGFLVRNGELGKRVRDVCLLGKTLETLASIDFVGDGFELESGHCGKGGEWVPVGSGGPVFRARAVVGGRN
ncbi:MAG: TldD/PmbA family protein [archaeon]